MNSRTEQLDGWKEIACQLKRSVRSVQRWERNEKLTVRRHEHAHGGSALPTILCGGWLREHDKDRNPGLE